MKTLNELKTVTITESTDFTELKKEVLSLTEDEIVEYIEYMLDNQVDGIQLENLENFESENSDLLKFLRQPEFAIYHEKILDKIEKFCNELADSYKK